MKPLNKNIKQLHVVAGDYEIDFNGTYLFVYCYNYSQKEQIEQVETVELHVDVENPPTVQIYFYDNTDPIEEFVDEVTIEAQDFYFKNYGSWATSKLEFRRSGRKYLVHNVQQLSVALADEDVGQFYMRMLA